MLATADLKLQHCQGCGLPRPAGSEGTPAWSGFLCAPQLCTISMDDLSSQTNVKLKRLIGAEANVVQGNVKR